jgi:hypothetical protein
MMKSVLTFEEVESAKPTLAGSGPEIAVSFTRASNTMVQVSFLDIFKVEI